MDWQRRLLLIFFMAALNQLGSLRFIIIPLFNSRHIHGPFYETRVPQMK